MLLARNGGTSVASILHILSPESSTLVRRSYQPKACQWKAFWPSLPTSAQQPWRRDIHMQVAATRRQEDTSKPLRAGIKHGESPALTSSSNSNGFQSVVEGLLSRAAVANQRISLYAGTDYSGILRLRAEIAQQENIVNAAHTNVDSAKTALDNAHAAQAASHKEVVSLLERKSSWSASDLDRYTSLIRSEHGDEQAVTIARNALVDAGKELENGRTELQRKMGQLYQEQQLRSDTIAQNGTWFAVMLMGFNVLLLVVNIVVFEPWRRRRIVSEFEAAFERHSDSGRRALGSPAAEVEASKLMLETNRTVTPAVGEVAIQEDKVPDTTPDLGVEVMPISAPVVMEPSNLATNGINNGPWWSALAQDLDSGWLRTRAVFHEWSQGPFSNDAVSLKKVEVTSIALEGAAAGLAIASCIFLALRSG